MKTNKPDKRPLDVRLRELLVDFDIEIVDAAVNGDDGLVRTFVDILADYTVAYPKGVHRDPLRPHPVETLDISPDGLNDKLLPGDEVFVLRPFDTMKIKETGATTTMRKATRYLVRDNLVKADPNSPCKSCENGGRCHACPESGRLEADPCDTCDGTLCSGRCADAGGRS